MKIRLTSLQIGLAVVGATLISLCIYFAATFYQQQDQKARLVGQLDALEVSLQRLVQPGEAEAAGSRDPFPNSVPGVQVADLIVVAASQTGTEVVSLHSSSLGTEQIGSNAYRVVRVDVQLKADPARLADFLDIMHRGNVPTMVIDNVNVNRTDADWDVTLEVLAYAQAG